MNQRFENFAHYITQLYRFLQKIKEVEMKELGLKASCTMPLYYLGMHEEGLSVTELVKLTHEDKASVSRALSDLIAKDLLVSPVFEKRNYRGKYTLSPLGKEKVKEIEERIEEALFNGGEGINEEERKVFYRCLSMIQNNLQEYENTLCERKDA